MMREVALMGIFLGVPQTSSRLNVSPLVILGWIKNLGADPLFRDVMATLIEGVSTVGVDRIAHEFKLAPDTVRRVMNFAKREAQKGLKPGGEVEEPGSMQTEIGRTRAVAINVRAELEGVRVAVALGMGRRGREALLRTAWITAVCVTVSEGGTQYMLGRSGLCVRPLRPQRRSRGNDPGTEQKREKCVYIHTVRWADGEQERLGLISAVSELPSLKVVEYVTSEGRPYYWNSNTNTTQWDRPLDSPVARIAASAPTQHPSSVPAMQSFSGTNLFVFHLPNEWREEDMARSFGAFGTIVSARIMTDRDTGRSRGFGFVSYDNPQSAQTALRSMNGFSILGKRLKVQFKKEALGTAPH